MQLYQEYLAQKKRAGRAITPNASVSVRKRNVHRVTELEKDDAKHFPFLRQISKTTWSIIVLNWTQADLILIDRTFFEKLIKRQRNQTETTFRTITLKYLYQKWIPT